MFSSLTCPKCLSRFKTVTIEDDEVRCPDCGETIFQYRFPGEENLTPKEFMALLDTRGTDAIRQCRRWFRGKFALVAAAAFVPYLWTFLARTFEKASDEQHV